MKHLTPAEKEWIALLKDAIDNNAKITLNHGCKYKGRSIASFLIDSKKRNKIAVIEAVEKLGFRYNKHSKKPDDILAKFIEELWNDPKPFKGKYITRFNMYIQPKKKILNPELKEELNVVWKKKFGDHRKWVKPTTLRQRVNNWKKIRYNEELNPQGKWYPGTAILGNIYIWVYKRKTMSGKMDEIIKYFNEQEVNELLAEGFIFNNPYYKKPKYKRIRKEDKVNN